MSYKFKYKRFLFWNSYKVIGHTLDEKQNKLVLFFEDGSIREIKKWTDCEVQLGTDWVIAQKKVMEKESGQVIPLSVGN